jgi:hypothetical protein
VAGVQFISACPDDLKHHIGYRPEGMQSETPRLQGLIRKAKKESNKGTVTQKVTA